VNALRASNHSSSVTKMSPLQMEMSFHAHERKQQIPLSRVPIDESFPEREANELAHIESFNKHLFRPNTYLHKWWARRAGTTFRFILKQLVPDAHLRNYYAAGGLEGITILDPMMGGGTTLHEAIRLGANVIGCDLDPIPVLQARASLSEVPLEQKELVFQDFLSALEERLRPYFQTRCPDCAGRAELQFMLYGARKSCDCGEALVVDSFLLREETDGRHKRLDHYYPALVVKRGRKEWRFFEKGNARCLTCDKQLGNTTDVPFAERYVPLLTVGLCQEHGQFFKQVESSDLNAIRKAKKAAASLALPTKDSLRVLGGPKSSDLLSRKIEHYSDLFTARQLLYLGTAKKLIDGVEPKHRFWLALLVSTSLEFNSALCGYKGSERRRPGAIRHVFSHHAYSFPYTSLENNPIFSRRTSGTLRRLFDDRIKDASVWASTPIERKPTPNGWGKTAVLGEVDGGSECSSLEQFVHGNRRFILAQCDSSRLSLPNKSVDYVVTDPPYFDSVQYSDLSHFFRVWLQWFLPKDAKWDFTPLLSAVAETEADKDKYRRILTGIWSECNRVLRRPHGRLIFTFHHWRADAWIQLTMALKAAAFRLVTSYTVHSENPISVHINNLKALKHDSILVLEPNGSNPPKKKFSGAGLIDDRDSFSFCRDCAGLLGDCLDSEVSESEIISSWHTALGK
jgi:putative DNA methylase